MKLHITGMKSIGYYNSGEWEIDENSNTNNIASKKTPKSINRNLIIATLIVSF